MVLYRSVRPLGRFARAVATLHTTEQTAQSSRPPREDVEPMNTAIPRLAAPLALLLVLSSPAQPVAADRPAIPRETAAEARARHDRVAARRKGTDIICH